MARLKAHSQGLEYIPRYTPIVRALLVREPLTVGEIAAAAHITQPAATQTVALMIKKGLLSVRRGTEDGRQRLIRLTRKGRAMLPKIEQCWEATSRAHYDLEAEIGIAVSEHLDIAIAALEKTSMSERIARARSNLTKQGET